MPNFNIIKEINPIETFRVASIKGTYDLQTCNVKEVFTGNLDINFDYNIGVIVGNSGTGKSTIAKELFKDSYFNKNEYVSESILDDMPKIKSIEEICRMFNTVGFSSPPSWLKPYNVLSNGEKMRVDLANCLLQEKELIVFDEFTSVVDRNIAQIGSFAVQKTIRRLNKKFIAISCHYDILEWLEPDWIFNTNTMEFKDVRGLLRRPQIQFEIYESTNKSFHWKLFSKYHYLSHSHNNAAKVYILFINGCLAGFSSLMTFPHPIAKNMIKEHRTVLLPDYQGCGFGAKLRDIIANHIVNDGKRYITTTSNPSLIKYMQKSNNWICTRKGRTIPSKISKLSVNKSIAKDRITTSWEYIKL
jgi:ABC-type lipoprotein export system ATPase subunit